MKATHETHGFKIGTDELPAQDGSAEVADGSAEVAEVADPVNTKHQEILCRLRKARNEWQRMESDAEIRLAMLASSQYHGFDAELARAAIRAHRNLRCHNI